MPKNFLFHPPLVHFPVAFFFLEAMLVLLWLKRKEENYEKFSYLTLKLAVALMPFAMLAGLKDANGIPKMARTHVYFAAALFLCNASRLLFRWRSGAEVWVGKRRALYVVWVSVGLVLTVCAGYFGGELAYD